MEYLSDEVLVAAITGLFAFLGNLVANSKNMAVLQERINSLGKAVEKHNQVIERTYKLEQDLGTAFERIDSNKEDIQEIKEDLREK